MVPMVDDPLVLPAARLMVGRAGIPGGKVCLVVESGSSAHGLSSGASDVDLTVVWTEDLRDLVTGAKDSAKGSRVIRTQPDGVRSGPGDIDIQVHTMRKFMSLAAAGNPSVLSVLFTSPEFRLHGNGFPMGQLVDLVVSRRAGAAYLGYLDSQLKRWRDGTISQRASRPELIAEHLYDTKFAAHAIRLAIQGQEYLLTGRVTLPIPEPTAQKLRDVRAGLVPEAEALVWCEQEREHLIAARDASQLPKHPDMAALDDFLVQWHKNRL